MSDVDYEMQKFAIEMKEECTKRGYTASICLADGLGHGEFHHNIEEVDYSMIRFIEKKGKIAVHIKAHMKSEPVKTEKTVNAIAMLAEIIGMNAMTYISVMKFIKERLDIEEEESKIIPFK